MHAYAAIGMSVCHIQCTLSILVLASTKRKVNSYIIRFEEYKRKNSTYASVTLDSCEHVTKNFEEYVSHM